jgi:O-antigen ligase
MPLFTTNKQALNNISYLLLVISLSIDFYIPKHSITLFYLVSYVSILYSLYSFVRYLNLRFSSANIAQADSPYSINEETKIFLLFVGSIFLLGLSKGSWALLNPSIIFHDTVGNYLLSGKRLVIAAFMVFYFHSIASSITIRSQRIASIILLFGLAIMSVYGFHQFYSSHIRIQLNTDSATTAAYQIAFYLVISLVITLRAFAGHKIKVLLVLLNLVFAAFLLCLTETRSAILLMPFLLLLFFCKNIASLSKKQVIFSLVMVVGIAAVMIASAWQRIDEVSGEVLDYQKNNSTSVGARFSMWQAAAHSLSPNFFGQSSDARYHELKTFIIKNDNGNPEAIRNIFYHVHNEVLESFSLQGIFGFIAILTFYLSLIILSFHKYSSHRSVIYIAFPIIAFGLSDVIFLQSAATMALSIDIALLMSLRNPVFTSGTTAIAFSETQGRIIDTDSEMSSSRSRWSSHH